MRAFFICTLAPGGTEIGEKTYVMHGSILHVYNFRGLPHSGIRIGRDSLIGEMNVIRGQGGVTIGDRALPRLRWCRSSR
ncbi:MAG: hypothetical protein R2748_04695 [Bryobacterales bacterium]